MKIKNISLEHHITVDALALRKFNHILFGKYALEFTAFCHGEKRENGEYHIYDIFFPNQQNTGTTTECDSEDLIALMKEGADISSLTGHMHSHVNMNVFSSGTDETDIIERAKDCGYNAAIILNKKGEVFGHIADLDLGIYVEDVPVYMEFPFTDEEYEKKLLAQVKKASTLKDVKTLMNFSKWDYLDMHYPMPQEEKDALDEIQKTRFKFKSYNSGKKNSVQNVTPTLPITYLDDEEKDVKEIMPTNPFDFFTVEELQIIEECKVKTYAEMTDREWALYQEYETYYYDSYNHY